MALGIFLKIIIPKGFMKNTIFGTIFALLKETIFKKLWIIDKN
jgi:hypothetical protein